MASVLEKLSSDLNELQGKFDQKKRVLLKEIEYAQKLEEHKIEAERVYVSDNFNVVLVRTTRFDKIAEILELLDAKKEPLPVYASKQDSIHWYCVQTDRGKFTTGWRTAKITASSPLHETIWIEFPEDELFKRIELAGHSFDKTDEELELAIARRASKEYNVAGWKGVAQVAYYGGHITNYAATPEQAAAMDEVILNGNSLKPQIL